MVCQRSIEDTIFTAAPLSFFQADNDLAAEPPCLRPASAMSENGPGLDSASSKELN